VKAASVQSEILPDLSSGFGRLKPRERRFPDHIPTGVPQFDSVLGGLPRGVVTEIAGHPSSGRTSLMLSALASATESEEVCAFVDATDSFDVVSANAAGIELDRLLWVRCSSNVEHAFKVADFLLHGGGFGLIVLDLGDVAPDFTSRIVSSWWYRFRRAVEDKPTAFVVISQTSCVKSAASLAVELSKDQEAWTAASDPLKRKPPPNHSISNLLRGMRLRVEKRRPAHLLTGRIEFATQVSYQANWCIS
jgi:hypothetical protein